MAERYRLGQSWHRNRRLGTVPAVTPSVSTCHCRCWDSPNLCGSSVSALSAGPLFPEDEERASPLLCSEGKKQEQL